jgi:cytochrome c peroxidase
MQEPDRRALEAYLLSIPIYERGRVQPDGTPVEPATLSVKRGFELFKGQECVRCHPPPSYSRHLPSDMGTGKKIDPPTLRGVASTPPYGHNGRWPTLEAALRAILAEREIGLSEREVFDLLGYLKLL